MRPIGCALVSLVLLAGIHVARGGILGLTGKGGGLFGLGGKKKECDLSVGSWVPSTKYPVYESSCPYISEAFNCQKNGRPDGDFRHFEWKPAGCKLKLFNANKFAMGFIGQSVAIVGDNNAQYLFQSLRCRLDAANVKTVDFDASSVGWTGTAFKIKPWGTKVVFVHAPFLTEAEPMDPLKRSMKEGWNVHVDKINHKLTETLKGLRSVILVAGSYYAEASNRTYFSKGKPIAQQPSGIAAFSIVLQNIADYVKSNVMLVQPYALSIPPSHQPNMFQYADTTCALFAGPLTTTAASMARARSAFVSWTNAQIRALSKSRVKLLNILSMSLYRADAHVGMYNPPDGSSEMDCGKWCLPGVPDVWLDMWYHQASDPFNLRP